MMDRKDKIDITRFLKEPSVKITIIIAIVVISLMYLTQSYWMNIGIKAIYNEYQVNDGFFMSWDERPDGVFILSGNYSYISHWINTTAVTCPADSQVKLLVVTHKTDFGFKDIIVLKAVEGCK